MKLKDIELALAIKGGIIDLDLKAPGVKAVVTIDGEVYEAWAKPAEDAAAAAPGEPPVANGFGTSPSFTLGEWSVLLAHIGQGIAHIAHQRQDAAEDDGEGEPRAASLSEEQMRAAAANHDVLPPDET